MRTMTMITERSERIAEMLERAASSKDADEVELALTAAFRAGLTQVLVPTLVRLLGLPWHERHEDVVGALQQLRDPRAVPALLEASSVKHAYLDYDELDGLARKCTWALADIGTKEALEALRMIAERENALVAGYARRRIERWDRELDRKGTRSGSRIKGR